MAIKEIPHYTLPASTLADWIESQPDQWWSVDGEPTLMGVLSFPCPSDELAPAIRRLGKGKDLLIRDKFSRAHGEVIGRDQLDALADTNNWRHRKRYLFSWADSDIEWLLLEDEAMVA